MLDRHARYAAVLGAVLALGGCGKGPRLALQYQLLGALMPTDVVRVETRVAVAPGDPRAFTADLPFRAVDVGVGYEVRDFDGNGVRTVLITHDASLGYAFSPEFTFTLLPPVGDAPPLELRARALGAGLNQVLADTGPLQAAFADDGRAQLPLTDTRCAGLVSCGGNDTCCVEGCVDVTSALSSCGGCGQACGASGDTCRGGACRCNGGSACTAGQTCCPGVGCLDTATDPFHCGACDKVCALGETCTGGACGCGATTCGAGQVCCDGVCTEGGCTCNGIVCPSGSPLCCGSQCTDVTTDAANCGGCGKACAAPMTCAGGSCKCNGTAQCSTGDACCPDGCRNLATDPLDCGKCGGRCGDGESCTAGQCRCGGGGACGADKLCCGSDAATRTCIDPSSDKANCGQCGRACAATEQCTSGACTCPGTGMACSAGQTCCADKGCFDLTSDHEHCGSCDKACGGSEDCVMGACVPSTNPCVPSCVNGTTCKSGTCYCGGQPATCSLTGERCCALPDGAACVNTLSDPANCGGCGMSCALQGKDLCCGGGCANSSDNNSCGGCGVKCGTGTGCQLCNGVYKCVLLGTVCVTGGG